LSDSLRLTNGFRDRAVDLLPRVSLCFLAEDRAAAQRLAVAYPHLYFLLPDGVCYHGHTVTGGRKSGSGPLAMKREARELVLALEQREGALQGRVAQLEGLTREISGLEAELERLRGVQQAREKDRVALDHEMRKLGEDLSRANSRVSVARLELDRLQRDAAQSLEQKAKNEAAVEEKERQRAEREAALEIDRQEVEKLEADAAHVSEQHAAVRAELAGLEERDRAERSALARLEQQFHEIRPAG
jgi:chromosome segregation protein